MSYWAKTYGVGVANAVALAENGDIIVAGERGGDAFVARLDREGNAKWFKTYGGLEWDEARAVAVAPNGDIIVAGYTYSFGAGSADVWVLRLDEDGNIKWQKTYGGSKEDGVRAVALTPNGDIIIAGYTKSFGTGEKDVWVLRLDANGNVKWQKTYGGMRKDGARAVALAPNGDIIVAGYYGATDKFGPHTDVWVLRLDENGNIKWQKTYGRSDHEKARAVALAPNGDIIVAGYTKSFGTGGRAVWVLRLDANGNIKWQKTYGGNENDEAHAVAVAPNGDIIVAGYTESFGAGSADVWVLRLDEDGNIKWQKTYGGSDSDRASAVALAPNGDIIVAGYTKSFGADEYEVWILRLPSDGNLPGCDFCHDSKAQASNSDAKVHNTNCKISSEAEVEVRDSDASVNTITPSVETQYSEDEERLERQLSSALVVTLPALTEGVEAPLKLTLTNNIADSLKAVLDFSENDFLELEEAKLEFPKLEKGKRATRTLTVKPKYAGSFDFKIKIHTKINDIELEAEKIIPVKVVAEKTALLQTPATPVTPTPAPAGLQLPPEFPPQLAHKYTEIELIEKGGAMRCAYEYQKSIKECPHEAVENGLCIFHLPEGGKNFRGAKLEGEDLEEAYLSEASLESADLRGANLVRADLSDANLSEANLDWALLYEANLSGAKAKRANFTHADLRNADLSGASLIGANLSLANLENANLARADLRGAELYGANLNGAYLMGADLRGAKLYGADLSGVRGLESTRIDVIIAEEKEGDRLSKEGDFEGAVEAYREALSVYLSLKLLFREKGLYDRSSWYAVGEWRVRGKLQRIAHRHPKPAELAEFVPLTGRSGKRWLIALEGNLRYFANLLYRLTSNYGESASRVLTTTVAIILVFALVFLAGGTAGSLMEALYFSVITFTTGSYGDIVPSGAYRLAAAAEAIIGAFMMAFFVVVISRKLIK
ncbi:pentapeptide repeat-containing protein [Thermococcus zilligii]|uniref:pentapeptide repeat-containing protein n=1 Tax=Thermococcus zilligii TaxID=54076 RepID=UPI00029AB279|nr:pentapeptide repeat-containing protein [Thermococcus zilligii]